MVNVYSSVAALALFANSAAASTKWSVWTDAACTASTGISQTLNDGQCYSPTDFCSVLGSNSTSCIEKTKAMGMVSFKETVQGSLLSIMSYNCTGCGPCAGSAVPFPCGQCISTGMLIGAGPSAYFKADCSATSTTIPTGSPAAGAAGSSKSSGVRSSPLLAGGVFVATLITAFAMVL
ncbi:expressed protein [Batrachochytrium dendrobatidis JAM81]|uniref:Expressed protein n=1 Tax=Batrachochytrium dendrobatidis (strain JAM81 / FGSC 10211) TaxID=684364 RepID=F4P621_BATDJ|nr:uncharacterized protein BATDEDRAFT_89596 [Batrachochytrium dendrobatidis JAM81]EGF79279.1 expressed protein [Batrachochytrium dendrobatidis JAM81]|eukprot:XP_006680085.1 expressed protein [Batrachochytrium dendrobatidis JAM81]